MATNTTTKSSCGTDSGTNEEGAENDYLALIYFLKELTDKLKVKSLGAPSGTSYYCVQVLLVWQEYTRKTYLC